MDINLSSQIVVQTAAQWAVDATVYSNKRILVTSDAYYGSTDQRKFKIADGVQTWAQLDYMPIEQVTTSTIGSAINGATSATPNDTDLVMSVDTSVAKKNTWTQIKAFLKSYFDTVYKATFTENTAFNKNFGTGTTNIVEIGSTLGNSLITSTDANGKLQTLTTATYPSLTELSYVKGLTSDVQTQLNTKLTSANITQTITNGVTDKAPSEDAVYDALALKSDKGFVICGGWATTAPADATTYYANSIAVALNTGVTNMQAFYIPKDCTLKAAFINVISGAASNETVTYNAYIGGSATLIATDNSTLTNFTISNTGMALACTKGQEVKLQIVTPAWVTNPVSHRGAFTFYFE